MVTSDEITQVAAIPCAACGNKSECEIWSTPVCYVCAADYGAKMPDYGAIHRKYGNDCDTIQVYRDFTARWLERRKARAA